MPGARKNRWQLSQSQARGLEDTLPAAVLSQPALMCMRIHGTPREGVLPVGLGSEKQTSRVSRRLGALCRHKGLPQQAGWLRGLLWWAWARWLAAVPCVWPGVGASRIDPCVLLPVRPITGACGFLLAGTDGSGPGT